MVFLMGKVYGIKMNIIKDNIKMILKKEMRKLNLKKEKKFIFPFLNGKLNKFEL